MVVEGRFAFHNNKDRYTSIDGFQRELGSAAGGEARSRIKVTPTTDQF